MICIYHESVVAVRSRPNSAVRVQVSPETQVLAAICVFDMLTTIYFVKTGAAVEANPLLAVAFKYGYLSFALAKLVISLVPLALIETLRPSRPQFCTVMLRIGIAGYVICYFLGSTLASTLLGS